MKQSHTTPGAIAPTQPQSRRDFLAGAFMFGGGWAVAGADSGDAVSVRSGAGDLTVADFGAKGDGKTDDTTSFQKAMDECARLGGGIVTVPPGQYLIKTHLAVPKCVTLEGIWRAPATTDGKPLSGSVLLAVEGAGKPDGPPFITLRTNSTLKGVSIFYPEQTKTNPPVAYPWTVSAAEGGATNPAIVDVLMVNPYQAVDFGSHPSPRHHIRNLNVQALYRGIYVDQCMDIGRIENVHLWPFWDADLNSPLGKFTFEQGEGLIFGRTDWEQVLNCFVINLKTGFRFARHAPAGFSRTPPSEVIKKQGLPTGNVLISGGGADLCETAVLVEDAQHHAGVSFVNAQIYGDVVVEPTNTGMVSFTSCRFIGTMHGAKGVALAHIAGRARVSFSHCYYCPWDVALNQSKTLIHARSGKLGIDSCTFINRHTAPGDPPPQIILEPDVLSAVITGNDFYGRATIKNHSRGKVQIANNVEQTE